MLFVLVPINCIFLTIATDTIDLRVVYTVTKSMNLEFNQNLSVIIV